VARLTPQSPRRWGKLTVDRAVTHLSDQLRMALGEIAQGHARGPFRFAPVRYLGIHVMPWPRGRIQGPVEAFTTSPADFAADRERLAALIARVGERDPDGAWPHHVLFGRMRGRDWGVLSHRHIHHHLTQFSA
jgi:hypothetical protein